MKTAPPTAPHVMLAFLMEQQGVRQADLAQQLGFDQSNASRLVSGKKAMTADLIRRLSEIFRVPVTAFLG